MQVIATLPKLSYSAARKELALSVEHSTIQYENNGYDLFYPTKAYPHTRQQEIQMRKFKSQGQAQQFLSCHGVINNLFRPVRHLMLQLRYFYLQLERGGGSVIISV